MREIHGLIAQTGGKDTKDVTVREWAGSLRIYIGCDSAVLTTEEARRLADMLREAVDNIETGKTQ